MSVEYYVQVIAPIINAFSTLILVVVTAVYVWLTKRVVDESVRQNRPYIFLRLDDAADRRDLLLVNTGNRVARDIGIEILRDASISVNVFTDKATTEETSVISNLAMSREGVPTLPPEGEMTVGFIQLRKQDLTAQRLEYVVRYHDGIGRQYQESALLVVKSDPLP
jgi:hypothetical protein